jgi:hypothetical protein
MRFPIINAKMGDLLGTGNEFLLVMIQGEHTYVIRTLVWLLPDNSSSPILLLDVPGLVDNIPKAGPGIQAGIWIQRETYDGVNADTKGRKPEFWAWDEAQKTLTLTPSEGK